MALLAVLAEPGRRRVCAAKPNPVSMANVFPAGGKSWFGLPTNKGGERKSS